MGNYKFIERLTTYDGDRYNKKSIIPWIIAALALLCLIIGAILFFFVFKPFDRPSADSIVLFSQTDRLVADSNETQVDNKFWLEVSEKDKNKYTIKSAELYDRNNKLVGTMKKDPDNNNLFTVTVKVPIEKTCELKYYAKYDTTSVKDYVTKPVSLRVAASWPDAYYVSTAQTNIELDRLLKSDDYRKLTKQKRADTVVEFLNDLSDNDPKKGEPYVSAGSVKYDSSNNQIEFVTADRHRFYNISLEPR